MSSGSRPTTSSQQMLFFSVQVSRKDSATSKHRILTGAHHNVPFVRFDMWLIVFSAKRTSRLSRRRHRHPILLLQTLSMPYAGLCAQNSLTIPFTHTRALLTWLHLRVSRSRYHLGLIRCFYVEHSYATPLGRMDSSSSLAMNQSSCVMRRGSTYSTKFVHNTN